MRYLWGPRWARSERAGGRVLGLRRYATRWGSKGSLRRAVDTTVCACVRNPRTSSPLLRFSSRIRGRSFAEGARRERMILIDRKARVAPSRISAFCRFSGRLLSSFHYHAHCNFSALASLANPRSLVFEDSICRHAVAFALHVRHSRVFALAFETAVLSPSRVHGIRDK